MILGGDNYTVYKHTSPIGKVYIGITKMNPIRRWSNGKGYKKCTHFYNAIIKYGWDNFRHEILYTGLSREEAGINRACRENNSANIINTKYKGKYKGFRWYYV